MMFQVWVQDAPCRSNSCLLVSMMLLVGEEGGMPVLQGQSALPACIPSEARILHSWVVGNWSRCSRSCDAGVRSRSVVCLRRMSAAEEKALDDSACPQPRPPVLEACHGPACPPEWAALDWSEVSRPFPPAPNPLPVQRWARPGCWMPTEITLPSHKPLMVSLMGHPVLVGG